MSVAQLTPHHAIGMNSPDHEHTGTDRPPRFAMQFAGGVDTDRRIRAAPYRRLDGAPRRLAAVMLSVRHADSSSAADLGRAATFSPNTLTLVTVGGLLLRGRAAGLAGVCGGFV